jgi:hypothetical protein
MLGFFPQCYPDELLYSVCARYESRVKYPSKKAVLQELFGTTNTAAIVVFPSRLDTLISRLPTGSFVTAGHLIDRHTLLPFFSPFLPSSRVDKLRDDIHGDGGSAGHKRSGAMASRIPMPSHLRFCPLCSQEDVECFSDPYWHRLHQLPGVEVCPSHQTFLENSSVNLHADRKYLQFISADQATRTMPVRYVDVENRNHQVLLQLARDAVWLLEHPLPGTDLKTLQSCYLLLLIKRGLATYTGSIHVKRLLNEFSSHYSPTLLRQLNCELRGRDIEKTNWLLRQVRPSKHAQHPLYHLLLIHFLGCTVEEFFQLPEELYPFGDAPWPCLNPAAEHYRELVITEYQLSSRLRYGKPIGKFSCKCGFAYARTGPDSAPDDRFHVGRVISFGQVWEGKLKQMWEASSLSITEIGRRLGVDPLTIRRHATRLELSRSRSDKRWKPLSSATQLKGKAVSAAWEKKRRSCRSKWLSAMKQGRNIAMKALRLKLPREYAWLLQHDAAWLSGNNPQPPRRNLSTVSVDWKRRDVEYAAAVSATASRLIEAPGRPVQVTKTAIGRAIGAVTLLQQKLHKMPQMAQILASVVETREEYAVRRVWWASIMFRQENIVPREWQLVIRASVFSLKDITEVKSAVQSALSMIETELIAKHRIAG